MKKEFAIPDLLPPKTKRGGKLLRMALLAILFAGFLAVRYLFQIDRRPVRLGVVIFGVFTASDLAVMMLSFVKMKHHRGRTLVTITMSLIKYIAALVVLCWGLSIVGVDLSTIVTSVGILALIIGFGAESMIADVVTGIFMLFENQYNVGDIVEVGGLRGTVSNIGIRTTTILDSSGNSKIINNSDMTNIVNRSNSTTFVYSDIAIPYETDLEDFEQKLPGLLNSIHQAHEEVLCATPRYLGVQELEASGVLLRFLSEAPETEIYNVRRLMNRELFLGFRKLGVEIPYTQIDVHTKQL